MKIQFLFLFLFIGNLSWGQSQIKKDLVQCLDLIFAQDEFQPAFKNNPFTHGAIIITAKNKISPFYTDYQKARAMLSQDDFRDFHYPIKVVQGNIEKLEDLGIPSQNILNFSFSGAENIYLLRLDTYVQDENLRYNWLYKLTWEDDELVIISKNVNTAKH